MKRTKLVLFLLILCFIANPIQSFSNNDYGLGDDYIEQLDFNDQEYK